MPDPNLIQQLLQWLGIGGGAAGAATGAHKLGKYLFSSEPDLQPCHTRIKHKVPGWPWAGDLAIHCSKEGQIHVRVIEPDAG